MHTRKHSVGRNILRVFEIALFFAVSVLGYGLMMKASSFNSKSKTRAQAPGLQSAAEATGDNRQPGFIPGNLYFPNETILSATHSGVVHSIEAFHALHGKVSNPSVYLTSMPDRPLRYGQYPDHLAFPHNLLQQNPVLLI
jgi:hypothetical protein